MSISRTHPVKDENFAATPGGLRFRAEIEFDRFPSIATLDLQTQSCSRFLAAVHHAIFAATVAGDSINYAVAVPLGSFQQLRIAAVMARGHQGAFSLPPAAMPRRTRPLPSA